MNRGGFGGDFPPLFTCKGLLGVRYSVVRERETSRLFCSACLALIGKGSTDLDKGKLFWPVLDNDFVIKKYLTAALLCGK